jgi:hypothetical protein
MAWYTTQPPGITRVEDFQISLIGKSTKHKLSTKAAETKYLCFFLLELLITHGDHLDRGEALLALGREVLAIIDILDGRPMRYRPHEFQEPLWECKAQCWHIPAQHTYSSRGGVGVVEHLSFHSVLERSSWELALVMGVNVLQLCGELLKLQFRGQCVPSVLGVSGA